MIYTYLVPQSLLFIPLFGIMVDGRPHQHAEPGLTVAHMGFTIPILHLAAHGLLHLHPRRGGGSGPDRRLHARRGAVPGDHADGAAGAGRDRVLLFHPERGTSTSTPIVFNTDPDVRTIPTGLSNMVVEDVFFWGPIMGSTFLTAIPPLDRLLHLPALPDLGLDHGSRQGLTTPAGP